jgi:hypothetical protein
MYTATDIVEMGNAQELILSLIKDCPEAYDDADPWTQYYEEYFDR